MMAIVKAKGLPYKDDTFPSGTNWEDYILWCLMEMGKECGREEAARIDAAQKVAAAKKAAAAKEATGNNAGSDLEEQEEGGGVELVSDPWPAVDNYPDASFFKCGVGFRAWALWGHIPIHDSAGMQSDFFDDTKKKASFGRKTESRAQLRKLLVQQNSSTVDNHRGNKRRASDDEYQTVSFTALPAPPSSDSKAILAKTLEYLNADSLENERKKMPSS
jgi:hypothetical protein